MQTGSEQLALWRSDFGAAYTDRNDRDQSVRLYAWRRLLEGVHPQATLEVGCNVGWNLVYLERLGLRGVRGVEPQAVAVATARSRDLDVVQGTAFALPFVDGAFELAFTSGVLIHISPGAIGAALDEIYRVSSRWIAAIEYDDPVEQEVAYRGHAGALWKRDHAALWRTRHPDLRVVRSLRLGAAEGYDDCTAHLFEKVR
ncbi:MAG TPA: pseudaminic acid biosynthesis-associated methylase [Kofleriaceae bacterium]|jgi:pseudaminic acid biosynthesis-associated methylase